MAKIMTTIARVYFTLYIINSYYRLSNYVNMINMNFNTLNWYISFLVPVIGVGFFGWSAFSIIFFFCIESFLLGIFFVIKGLVGIYYTRKLSGVIFILLFSAIYFVHLVALTIVVGNGGEYFNVPVIPSLVSVIGSFLILLIPNILETIEFAKASKKDHINKKELGSAIDLIFDFKETMFRVFILWFIQPVVFGVVFLDAYFHLPSLITSLIVIAIFCAVRFMFESNSQKERQSASNTFNIFNGSSLR